MTSVSLSNSDIGTSRPTHIRAVGVRGERLRALVPVLEDRVLGEESAPVVGIRGPHDVPSRIGLDLLVPIPDAHSPQDLPLAVTLLAEIAVAATQEHRRRAIT